MKTPWNNLGELTDFEMGAWIVGALLLGGILMTLTGTVAEKIGDKLRKFAGDRQRLPSYWQQYLPEPPRYWRDLRKE